MSNDTEIEIEGDSAEAVALALLQMVARAEGKLDEDGAWTGATRAWILDTYAECLQAVDGERIPGLSEEDEEGDEEDDDEDDEDEEEEEADTDGTPAR